MSSTRVEALQARVGSIDAVKLRSSLTLFIAAGGDNIFRAALQRWFDDRPDEATLRRLA